MSKLVILVALEASDPDAQPFRDAIAKDPALKERAELRFATGDAIAEHIATAEIAWCGNLSPAMIERAEKLRWISFWSAGVDGKITPQLLERKFQITTASGVHGANIGEHIMAWMLMFARDMHLHVRSQAAGEWRRSSTMSSVSELTGKTLGIVGYGRIGEGLAVRAKAFGMRVVALKRNPEAQYDKSVSVDHIYAPSELRQLLGESDHVCISLPLTPDTYRLFDAETLACMKPSAYLYNVARGKVVDEKALIAALQEGRIAGAGLDVFEEEPLPADSPLWKMENVIITPHTAGQTPYYFVRAADLFAENLHRYINGEALNNLYRHERGY